MNFIPEELYKKCVGVRALSEITKITGVDRGTLTYRKEQLGLVDVFVEDLTLDQIKSLHKKLPRSNSKRPPYELSQDVIDYYLQGNSLAAVASKFDLKASTLSKKLRDLGVSRSAKESTQLSMSRGAHISSKAYEQNPRY
ncbi:hypothetical protein [Pseudoalteromonas marina]|uniref:TyrR family helix-turn-helix domain-containing protein n=1 Tax=Pseudoalteromonas marina TaxID=267375 RepID=A0ABT9FIR3_9GAMM|nr:hypothetical protein [Pseudoalteromonas marina]MDP2566376.1 hypothetical protein [Pseudoalteromonas marina]